MRSAALARFNAIPRERRPLWLTTLADLGLLLVGFLVLVHATGIDDHGKIAKSIRAAFDAPMPEATAAAPLPAAMPVDIGRIGSFVIGSATPSPAALDSLANWARGAASDPRTEIILSGATDGSSADVDADSGSAAILAADRARAVAAGLIARGVVAPDQIRFESMTAARMRAVTATIGFRGKRQ